VAVPTSIHNAIMMNRLIHREYLAHTLAYIDKDLEDNPLTDGSVIKVPSFSSINGKMVDAVVHKIETGHKSLVGYVLEIDDHEHPPRVEIVFRGTHNMASAHMDLEFGGAGAQSYHEARERIISQINAVVEHVSVKSGGRVIVGVSGHSLGGALAQRCIADLACAMVQNDADLRVSHKPANASKINAPSASHIIDLANTAGFAAEHRNHLNIHNILKLELAAFNSTGIDDNTYRQAHFFSEYLQNPFYGHKQKKVFSITADYCLNSRDGVQQTGSKNIFANCPFSNVNLFKFNPPRNGYKQVATAGVAATLAATALGPLGLLLSGLGVYKMLGTCDAHTAKHASFEKYNLVLNNAVFEIYSNKKPNNGGRDQLGEAKISQQLLGRKSFIVNNPVSRMATASFHFITKPVLGDSITSLLGDELAKAKIASLKEKTESFRRTSLSISIGG
jgi:hypothetical protein